MGCIAAAFYKKGTDGSLKTDFKSLHDIPALDIDGNLIDPLGLILEGKKCIVVVNVASKWGTAKRNYTQLVQLHREYRELGFEILAFPCNQFIRQEPGTDQEIKAHV